MTKAPSDPPAPPAHTARATVAAPASDRDTSLSEPALYRLLAWSSPGYPTGAFSYSHGLEWAVEAGTVTNLQTLLDYVTAVLSRGGGWIDAVLFAHAWRATPGTELSQHAQTHAPASLGELTQLATLTELAAAFRGSSETALESLQQGTAFLDVTRKAWPHPILDTFAARLPPGRSYSASSPAPPGGANTPVAHCIAVAVACAAHNIALVPALHAYLHAVAANLVSAGARLIPLGQTQAQIAIARLSPTLTDIIERALQTPLDDLGTAAPAIELCSLRHETQYTRLFRS